jgi:hypothetical protein
MAEAALMMRSHVARKHAGLAAVALGLLLGAGGCVTDQSAGLTVWVADDCEPVLADTPPRPENEVYSASAARIRVRAALNETVGLQTILRADRSPAGPYAVSVTDLRGDNDTIAADAHVRLFRAHYTRVAAFGSWYPDHTGRPATPILIPDILVPWEAPRGGGPLPLAEPRNEIVWIDVHVPATIAPGRYAGHLEVHAGRTLIWRAAMEIDVQPVALPSRRSLPVVARVDPRDLLATHLEWPRMPAEQTRILPDDPSHRIATQLAQHTMQTLQAHRLNPILWASFPKFTARTDRRVDVQWEAYDALVAGWLDGSAFADRVPLDLWPLPASTAYPSALRNGGIESAEYARLAAGYIATCAAHFTEREWDSRAFLRPVPPGALNVAAVDTVRRWGRIVRQSEASVPLTAHLPSRSLRGLGWQNAPTIELPSVGVWAPPAMWYEPAPMERQRKLDRRTWLMPDEPPYSASLTVAAPALDARVLAWQAYRYDVDALWIEHAAEPPNQPGNPRPASAAGLLYAGEPYGMRDRPVPSMRLKRLRRGVLDYEYLKLLEANGKQLLAERLADQIVRWATTDACRDNLLTCANAGWPRDAWVLRLARRLMLSELVGEFTPTPAARQEQIANLAQWGTLLGRADRIAIRTAGVRLETSPSALAAEIVTGVSNATDRDLRGTWSLREPPPGWALRDPDTLLHVPAGAHRTGRLTADLAGLTFNVDGVYPFELLLSAPPQGEFLTPGRLAVAVCPSVASPPTIDGKLDDWPVAANNAAGDFQLCRGAGAEAALAPRRPTLGTRAAFCMDTDNVYVGVQCVLAAGQPPQAATDNVVPVDGAVPWGQDVVELLLDPTGTGTGTMSDLYCVQIKPTGLVLSQRGCHTEPPMGTTQPWPSGARVAVDVRRDRWIVELALPLNALPADARRAAVWGVNVTRLDARLGEYSSWSGAAGNCYMPRSLGNVIMLWQE